VEIRILGPVEVERDGRVIAPGSRRERAVLATLALSAGRAVSIDTLVDALWGDTPPPSAARTVRSHVSRLRRVVGRELLTAERGGYRLDVDPDVVDAVRLERAVTGARSALDHGEASRARVAAGRAVALWRGEPLTDLADSDSRRGRLVRLEELLVTARELRLEAELALGHHEAAVADLEVEVADQPLREPLWALLMLALYRSGRQADALRAYARLRSRLGDELGIEPSPELAHLERAILCQDPQLDPDPPPPPSNLPAPVSSFVGRIDEIDHAVALTSTHRLVTLLGPGGVGKSRLAIEVAARVRRSSPDGVWWIDLASVDAPEAVPARAVDALGVTPSPGSTPEQALVDVVRSRRMVLVVDNCEHVRGAAARLIDRLLVAGAGLSVIATSRVALGLEGECHLDVAPLQTPPPDTPAATAAGYDAVALLSARLADRSAPIPSTDLDLAAEVCRMVDGLPLAIELVAAHAAPLGLAAVRDRLDRRLDLLTGTSPVAEARHASIRAALDGSYELLDPGARLVFDRLSVIPGNFDLAAAVAVGTGDQVGADEVPAHLSELVESSMVVAGPGRDGQRRFRLLETLRDYGLEHLVARGEDDPARRRHADHFRVLAGAVGTGLHQLARHGSASRTVRDEAHNLDAALRWSLERDDPARTLELVDAVGELWYRRGQLQDLVELVDSLLERGTDLPPARRGWATLRIVWPLFLGGDQERALARVDEARELLETSGDRAGVAAALHARAHMITLATGDIDEALRGYRAAVELSRTAGAELDGATALAEAAQALALADRPEATLLGMTVPEMLDAAERALVTAGDDQGLAHVALSRWLLAAALDDPAAVRHAADDCLAHARAADSRIFEQMGVLGHGVADLLAGELEPAALHVLGAARLALDDGNLLQLGPALQCLAGIAGAHDDAVDAARLWGAATRLAPAWPLIARTVHGRFVAPACAALGDRLDDEIEAGRAMDPAAALDLARRVLR